MATYRRCNGRVNVLVKVDGKQYSKTFDTKAEAQQWAKETERDLKNPQKFDALVMRKKPNETFTMAMQTYKRMVTPTKSQARDEATYIDRLSTARCVPWRQERGLSRLPAHGGDDTGQ